MPVLMNFRDRNVLIVQPLAFGIHELDRQGLDGKLLPCPLCRPRRYTADRGSVPAE